MFDTKDGERIEVAPTPPICQWFALCGNSADGTLPHPVLGDTPACVRCATVIGALDKLVRYAG